jgi:hypothetical protein
MKTSIVCVLLLCHSIGYSQFINQKIPDLNVEYLLPGNGDEYTKNTVCHDHDNNVVFFATDEASPTSGFELVKISSTGAFMYSTKVSNGQNSTLFPAAIISTRDDGFFVVGTYSGTMPATIPANSGTIFYAKFDNHLNLLTFKLYKGYPFSGGSLPNQWGIGGCAVASRPKGLNEEYFIVGMSSQSQPTYTNCLTVVKVNFNLVPILETHTDISTLFGATGGAFHPATINYLPGAHVFSITGTAKATINGGALAGYPAVITMDENLNFPTPLTLLQLPYAPLNSIYRENLLTNAVEDNKGNLIWSFTIPSPIGTVSAAIVKQQLSSLLLVDKREVRPANYWAYTIDLRNSGNDNFTLGMTDFGYDPLATMENVKPVLINIKNDFSVLNGGWKFNPYDYTDWNATYPFAKQNYNRLQAFVPCGQGYALHVTDYADWLNTGAYTRIITTDITGMGPCSKAEEVSMIDLEVTAYRYPLEPIFLQAKSVIINMGTSSTSHHSEYCAQNKPSSSAEGTQSATGGFSVYPNPLNGGEEIRIDGPLTDHTTVTIENMLGQIVFRQQMQKSETARIRPGKLVNGMYLLKIAGNGRTEKTEKLIMQ